MRLLESHRRRRRLMFATALVAAVPLVYLGVHLSTPGSAGNATGPYVKDDFYTQPKHVPFTAPNRRAVHKVLAGFVHSAVAKRPKRSAKSAWAC